MLRTPGCSYIAAALAVVILAGCTPAQDLVTPREIDGPGPGRIILKSDQVSYVIQRNGVGQDLRLTNQFKFEIDTSVSPAVASMAIALETNSGGSEKITQLYFRIDSLRADGTLASLSFNFNDTKNRSASRISLTNKLGSSFSFDPDQTSGMLDNFWISLSRIDKKYSARISYSTLQIKTGTEDTTQIQGEITER